jgi:hypothetical protein
VGKVPLNYDTVRSLTNAVKDLVLGREAPPILREERERICHTCPFRDRLRCNQCGCFIKTKVALYSSECPIGKWPSASDAGVNSTQENNRTQ